MLFSEPLPKPQLFSFFVFFCHVVINSEDGRSTHWNYSCLSFNRSWRQWASLQDCWARKDLMEGHHWSLLRFVFSWVNSPTVISPFVPPAKSMVYKSSQRRNHNTLSSLQQVWVFLQWILMDRKGQGISFTPCLKTLVRFPTDHLCVLGLWKVHNNYCIT